MQTSKSERNVELDIIKGLLVLIMLLYHCASVSAFLSLRVIMHKIDFIHYAFLAITGFLCGYHYHEAAQVTPIKVQRRLSIRALKILALFIFGNTIFWALGYGRSGLERIRALPDFGAVLRKFLLNVPDDLVAFEILYLIASFILLAAVLIRFRTVSWLLTVAILIPIIMPGVPILFMAIGCAGMLVGILAQEGRLTFMEPRMCRWLWVFPVLLVLRITCFAPLSKWVFGNEVRLVLLSLETLIWFYSFIWIVERLTNRWFQSQIILLGRYTLFAYMFQMVFARLVYSILYRAGLKDFYYYGASLVLVGMATYLMTVALDGMRRLWLLSDKAYRVVFQ